MLRHVEPPESSRTSADSRCEANFHRVMLKAALLAALVGLNAFNTFAQETASWNGSNGLWSTPSAWSSQSIPNNTPSKSYAVVINSGSVMVDSGLGTLLHPTPITVDSLSLTGTLRGKVSYPPQTLNVIGDVVNGGTIKMDSYWRSLNVGGQLTNSGWITPVSISVSKNLVNSGHILFSDAFGSSSLAVKGLLNNSGTIEAGQYSAPKMDVGRLENSGRLLLTGTTLNLTSQPGGIREENGFMELDSGATITAGSKSAFGNLTTVNGSLLFYLTSLPQSIQPASPNRTLTVKGTLGLSDGPVLYIVGNLTNKGSITLNDDQRDAGLPPTAINLTGTLTNSGRISLGGAFGNDQVTALKVINNSLITVSTSSSLASTSLTNAGTISVDGTFASSLVIGSGSVGQAFSGVNQSSDGLLNEVISSQSMFGQVKTTGAAVLAGTLEIILGSGYVPSAGTSFEIMSFAPGELSGAFSQVLFDKNDPFSITYDNKDGMIFVTAIGTTPTPEPATSGMMIVTCLLMISLFSQRFFARVN